MITKITNRITKMDAAIVYGIYILQSEADAIFGVDNENKDYMSALNKKIGDDNIKIYELNNEHENEDSDLCKISRTEKNKPNRADGVDRKSNIVMYDSYMIGIEINSCEWCDNGLMKIPKTVKKSVLQPLNELIEKYPELAKYEVGYYVYTNEG